ncbi:N-acetylmuramoyl-L-alanine amidase [Desulfobaculum bizertense DSM 18034]|uniref:N-acetylmuramoyl-L-alanine amidase n=2 Tax=Desulfobaculum TaxID=1433996 RepID=A0A1T4VDD2_9BACT|nr:N-acetylmuramoyl-L-alanine amidase [Desulfobaculum bizertense DSM 18034]
MAGEAGTCDVQTGGSTRGDTCQDLQKCVYAGYVLCNLNDLCVFHGPGRSLLYLITPAVFMHIHPYRLPFAERKKTVFLMLLFSVFCFFFSFQSSAQAATQAKMYQEAVAQFQRVEKSSSLSKRRDMWTSVHSRFKRVLSKNPSSSYAPKALYFMARSYEELARNSWLKRDARTAVDAYQRAENRFSRNHSWADDCLYRKAMLRYERLNDAGGAAKDLQLLLQRYPGGDKARDARQTLAMLAKKGVPEARIKAARRPSPPRSMIPDSRVPRSVRTVYDEAVDRLKGFRRSKSVTRDDCLRLARVFDALGEKRGAGLYAPRSLYHSGQTYEELGKRSGRRDDFEEAVVRYQRAFDSFPASNSWRDDCLYRKAYVSYTYLKKEDQAYADLIELKRNFPHGDMVANANAMLRKMDRPTRVASAKTSQKSVASVAVFKQPRRRVRTTGIARLTDIRHRSGDTYTRVVLDLDREINFEDHTLAPDPKHGKMHRLFVDLEKTRLGKDLAARVMVKDGILNGVRAGQNDSSTARVVFDFQSMQKYHMFTLQNPFRIVVDVYGDGDSPAPAVVTHAAAKKLPPVKRDHKPTYKERKVASDVLAQLGMTFKTIMIDAGHGGIDPGALDKVWWKDKRGRKHWKIRTREKEVALKAAKILGKKFERKGYRVLYTRTTDYKVQLEDRAMAANIKKADLFISLHCNANRKASVRGFETYYLGKARNNIVLRLAAKENNVDPVRISDTQKIVLDLVNSFKMKESRELATLVQKRCVTGLRRHYRGIKDHGARGAPFFVLVGARMPAILVEMGYITNPTEVKLLRSTTYLERVADGIVQGVEDYRKSLSRVGR